MSQQMPQDDDALSEVNVIPLADLSLVLLIILMVLSPMVSQALIQVAAAKAQAAEVQQDISTPETPIIVSDEPGALRLNGTLMGSELEFVTRLAQILGTRHDKSVNITAAPEMPHGKVVHLMDLIQRQGASSLVLIKWDSSANQPAAIAAAAEQSAQQAFSAAATNKPSIPMPTWTVNLHANGGRS